MPPSNEAYVMGPTSRFGPGPDAQAPEPDMSGPRPPPLLPGRLRPHPPFESFLKCPLCPYAARQYGRLQSHITMAHEVPMRLRRNMEYREVPATLDGSDEYNQGRGVPAPAGGPPQSLRERLLARLQAGEGGNAIRAFWMGEQANHGDEWNAINQEVVNAGQGMFEALAQALAPAHLDVAIGAAPWGAMTIRELLIQTLNAMVDPAGPLAPAGAGKPIVIPEDEFIEEHKRLIKTLLSGKKPELTKEAKTQIKELKHEVKARGGKAPWRYAHKAPGFFDYK